MSVVSSNIHVEKVDSYTGHRDAVYGLTHLSTDTDFLSCSGDGYVVLWNIQTPDLGTPLAKVKNSIYAVFYDVLTNYLWIGHNFDGVHLIDLNSRLELHRVALGNVALFDIKSAGDFIVVGDSSGCLTWLDRLTGTLIKQQKVSSKSIRSIAVQEAENRVILGSSDSSIYVLEATSGNIMYTLEGHTNSVFSLQCTKFGNQLVSGGRDAQLIYWQLEEEKGHLITCIPAHLYTINSLDISVDGKWLASGSLDKSVKIWDTQTYELVKVIDKGRYAGHGTSVNKVMWQKEDVLLTASDDRTISYWKIDFSRL